MTLICSATELAGRLIQGEAALFPTDTLPALATKPEAAARLWELKARPREKPVILMAASTEPLLSALGVPIEPAWQALAEQHWPGALTLVLPANSELLEQLNPGGGSLGLRVPNCERALELLRLTGPLATTSANRSGEPACLNAQEAAAQFPQVAQLGPWPWPMPSGLGSTVIAWEASGQWKLLRRGAVLPPELHASASD